MTSIIWALKESKAKGRPGTSGKTVVVGIFNRKGRVQTEIIPDARRKRWQDIIQGSVEMETIIHSGGWRGQNRLVDLGNKKQFRVDHGKKEFVRGKAYINGIESF